jgi:hypothetical protein
MAAFSETVPTGTLSLTPLEPTEWTGYPPNTVLWVYPHNGGLEPGENEIEIVCSGIDTSITFPYIEDVIFPVNRRTPNSFITDVSSLGLGGPWNGTVDTAWHLKPVWVDTEQAAIKPEYSNQVTVAWLKSKEIVQGTDVTMEGTAAYVNDYASFPGTGDSRMMMGRKIVGIATTDSTPHYLMLFEIRVPDTAVTMQLGDSDDEYNYYGWLLRLYSTRFDIMHGDGGTPGSAARRSVQFGHSAITNWTYTADEWFKVALYVSDLDEGRFCVNGGTVVASTGASGGGNTMSTGGSAHGQLGAGRLSSAITESEFDLRHFCMLEGTFTDAQIQEYCTDQYIFYTPS